MLYGYFKQISISRITLPIVVVEDSISERVVIEVEGVVLVLFVKLDIVIVDDSIKEN